MIILAALLDAAFAATFICVGEKPPVGGLFAENKYGDTNFWNERQPA